MCVAALRGCARGLNNILESIPAVLNRRRAEMYNTYIIEIHIIIMYIRVYVLKACSAYFVYVDYRLYIINVWISSVVINAAVNLFGFPTIYFLFFISYA